MKDTLPEIEKKFKKIILEKSPEERIMMGFSMFSTARRIVISSKNSDIHLKKYLFLRFYENDFDKETFNKIIRIL